MMKLLVISLLFSLASTEEGMSDLPTTAGTATSGKVTCIAPSTPVEEGKDISITFHFPFDVSQRKLRFIDVYLQPKNSHPERIASCIRPSCTTEKGYSIEGEVKTSLKLHIMNISVKQSGFVFCQVMLRDGEMPDVVICSLSVHDMSDLSTTTETAASVNVDGGAGDDESNIGLGVGVGVALVVVIVIVVYCCWYTKRRNSRNRPDVENSCFSMDPVCARNRRSQEENSRESEQMLPKHRKGNVNAHVPYSDRAELKNLMMYPMENVRQNGGKSRSSPLPKEYAKQESEQMLRKHHKENINAHVPYSDRAEVNNLMPSMENVQQADTEVIDNGTAIGDGRVVEIPMFSMRNVLRCTLSATLWMFKYSKMSQWLQWSEVEATK